MVTKYAKSKVDGASKLEKGATILLLYVVGSLAIRAYRYGIDVMQIVFWLNQLGIYNPPSWLVWTLLTAGTISLIVGALSTFGIVTVPIGIAKALLAADTFGM